ncbi:MAG: hypothetical protein E6Q96_04510 [Cyclobacteriaceae bacterium]|nr:MAG: hypothetical protein E6Q96_04510 [Cyclobacteriaceae bacterium]
MLLRITILLFSILLSGPGLEVKAEGSLSERSENIEVTIREACHSIQSIRMAGGSGKKIFIAQTIQTRPSRIHNSQPARITRRLPIQLRQLLI